MQAATNQLAQSVTRILKLSFNPSGTERGGFFHTFFLVVHFFIYIYNPSTHTVLESRESILSSSAKIRKI